MSIVVAWAGADNHGVTSAYIVADSRVTWSGRTFTYDACRKVFCSSKYPEIIGYCGDVLFPSIVINQLMELIDSGFLFDPLDGCRRRFEVFKNKLISEFQKYRHAPGVAASSFEIVYVNREIGDRDYLPFNCYVATWNHTDGWKVKTVIISEVSAVVAVLGSGKTDFQSAYETVLRRTQKGTSRAVFHAFVQTLTAAKSQSYGGPPQLVGLYRKPNSCGLNFGIIYNRKRYVLGTQVLRARNYDVLEWRNKYFELCDGNTRQKLTGAAVQVYPYSSQ